MNKSNILKITLAVLLIFVVVVATVNYGRNQRMKIANTDTSKNNLPTVQESKPTQKNQPNTSKPAQPKPESAPPISKPTTTNTPPVVAAQIPQSNMPATGPADSILPVIILGTLTGLYLVSRRKLKSLT